MEKFQNETKFTYFLSMDPFNSSEQRVSCNNENKSEAKAFTQQWIFNTHLLVHHGWILLSDK